MIFCFPSFSAGPPVNGGIWSSQVTRGLLANYPDVSAFLKSETTTTTANDLLYKTQQ